MIRESQTAVIARNEIWEGEIATEPYEAGWATEAVFFIRALAFRSGATAWSSAAAAPSVQTGPTASSVATAPTAHRAQVRVQLSADGMRWIDEGSVFDLPQDSSRDTFARVHHFGNWLRLAAVLPEGIAIKALVTIHLK